MNLPSLNLSNARGNKDHWHNKNSPRNINNSYKSNYSPRRGGNNYSNKTYGNSNINTNFSFANGHHQRKKRNNK